MTRGGLETAASQNLPHGKAALCLAAASQSLEKTRHSPIALERERSSRTHAAWPGRSATRTRKRGLNIGSATTNPRWSSASGRGCILSRPCLAGAFRDRTGQQRDRRGAHTAPDPSPIVTVFGRASSQLSAIMFILDYSGSMTKTMPVLLADRQTPVETPRYVVARTALQQILRRLVTSDNRYQVGLRVYGHRVGWEDDKLKVWDARIGVTSSTAARHAAPAARRR